MKKLGLIALIVLLLGVGVIAVAYHLILDQIGPNSVPRDYAMQDDSKVVAPVVEPVANGEASSSGGGIEPVLGRVASAHRLKVLIPQ